jgi:hypothetical protein
MAENWIEVLEIKRTVWGVPQGELDELKTLTIQGAAVLSKAKASNRSSVITAECNTAFTKLREKMQYIEQRWFNAPTLDRYRLPLAVAKSPDAKFSAILEGDLHSTMERDLL